MIDWRPKSGGSAGSSRPWGCEGWFVRRRHDRASALLLDWSLGWFVRLPAAFQLSRARLNEFDDGP